MAGKLPNIQLNEKLLIETTAQTTKILLCEFYLQNLLKNSLDTNKIMEEEFDFSKFRLT